MWSARRKLPLNVNEDSKPTKLPRSCCPAIPCLAAGATHFLSRRLPPPGSGPAFEIEVASGQVRNRRSPADVLRRRAFGISNRNTNCTSAWLIIRFSQLFAFLIWTVQYTPSRETPPHKPGPPAGLSERGSRGHWKREGPSLSGAHEDRALLVPSGVL